MSAIATKAADNEIARGKREADRLLDGAQQLLDEKLPEAIKSSSPAEAVWGVLNDFRIYLRQASDEIAYARKCARLRDRIAQGMSEEEAKARFHDGDTERVRNELAAARAELAALVEKQEASACSPRRSRASSGTQPR
ncbi:MAG: hypothetical protein JWM53_5993 [bacterium]|nr:hypothetical protein [bacterium]